VSEIETCDKSLSGQYKLEAFDLGRPDRFYTNRLLDEVIFLEPGPLCYQVEWPFFTVPAKALA